MYLHKTKNENYTPPCCYFSGELEVVECLPQTFSGSMMVTLFHKTSNDNIWRDVLDLTHESNLKLYIRDADYYIIGHHRNIEEKGDDSWIVLTEFIKHSKDDNQVIETHDGQEKDMIAIRLSDVEYAEIFN